LFPGPRRVPGTGAHIARIARIAGGGSIGGPLLRFAGWGRGASMETRCGQGNVAVPSLR
jgi:hypothetical protein